MKLQISKKTNSTVKTTVLPFYENEVDYDRIQSDWHINVISEFTGKLREYMLLYDADTRSKVYLLGLGPKKTTGSQSYEAFRYLAYQKGRNWPRTLQVDIRHLPPTLAYQVALGIRLASYRAGEFKTEPNGQQPALVPTSVKILHTEAASRKWANEGMATADTQIAMMRLVNSPANIKTPAYLGAYAKRSGKAHGFSVKVLKGKALVQQDMHALLAVGQGSANPPALIQLEYKPPSQKKSKHPTLGLVGKGITFDTGGLSIKGANNMHYMKSDMGGAAAVMGAVELAAKLKLDIHVVGIIPTAENSVDANSIRPGDVIQSHSGKSIEIIDTDAEGRLILADGLSYVQKKFKPQTVVDVATLTGSCVRALGYTAGGLFTTNEELSATLQTVGRETHERVWPFPMWEDYAADITSDLADVRNFSGKSVAGAISAAKFLEFFISDHPSWAHLDIAGVAFGSSDYTKMKSATGFGVRLLVAFMKKLIC